MDGEGSPPRVRGKERGQSCSRWVQRITPARAGKRVPLVPSNRRRRDHPRACGEKNQYPYAMTGYQGSPPRVRGKVDGFVDAVSKTRITPARAGKRHRRGRESSCKRDHPRACGEKI